MTGMMRVRGELLERFLLEDACHDAVNPAFKALRDVGNGFALAERRDGVVEKHGRAAQASDAHFKSDARAQRWLLEDHREEPAGKSAYGNGRDAPSRRR